MSVTRLEFTENIIYSKIRRSWRPTPFLRILKRNSLEIGLLLFKTMGFMEVCFLVEELSLSSGWNPARWKGLIDRQGEVHKCETILKISVEEIILNSDNRTGWETWGGWRGTDLSWYCWSCQWRNLNIFHSHWKTWEWWQTDKVEEGCWWCQIKTLINDNKHNSN